MTTSGWKAMMWRPDPWCRRCERRPAGSGALWSAPSAFPTVRSCGGPRNLPAWEGAPSRSEACGWTSDCGMSRERRAKWLRWAVWFTPFWEEFQMFTLSDLPVPGAVHGLECKDVFLHGEGEHVFAVVLPVARCLPQFAVVDIGGGYFLKASSPVLILEKQDEP